MRNSISHFTGRICIVNSTLLFLVCFLFVCLFLLSWVRIGWIYIWPISTDFPYSSDLLETIPFNKNNFCNKATHWSLTQFLKFNLSVPHFPKMKRGRERKRKGERLFFTSQLKDCFEDQIPSILNADMVYKPNNFAWKLSHFKNTYFIW